MAFRANSFKFLWKTENSKPPTIPFEIVACTFSDNLSRNSCISNVWRSYAAPSSTSVASWQHYFKSLQHAHSISNIWIFKELRTTLWSLIASKASSELENIVFSFLHFLSFNWKASPLVFPTNSSTRKWIELVVLFLPLALSKGSIVYILADINVSRTQIISH